MAGEVDVVAGQSDVIVDVVVPTRPTVGDDLRDVGYPVRLEEYGLLSILDEVIDGVMVWSARQIEGGLDLHLCAGSHSVRAAKGGDGQARASGNRRDRGSSPDWGIVIPHPHDHADLIALGLGAREGNSCAAGSARQRAR